MRKSIRPLIVATSTVAVLAGCEGVPWIAPLDREAGALANSPGWGDATTQNTQYMNGDRNWTVDLAQRFHGEVGDTVNFEFNSAVLDAAAMAILDRQAAWIVKFPEVRFKVFGYTDLVGSASYNKSLGKRRADAVVAYLTGRGVPRAHLTAVVSYGETRPLIQTPDRERANRRAVTEVSGFVEDNRMVLDGQYAAIVYREYVESATSSSSLGGSGSGGDAGATGGGDLFSGQP